MGARKTANGPAANAGGPDSLEVEVRFFRLPGGGLMRTESSPPGAGTPPEGAQEIDADTYASEDAAARAALAERLAEIEQAEQAAVAAHREKLAELGIAGELADVLLGARAGAGAG